MPEEWIAYRVTFVYYSDPGPQRRTVSMEVSAHPLRSARRVKRQVWLMLLEKGYELDLSTGSIEAVGTDTVSEG
ncbi:hypothetical protein C9F11_10255 [Streptomyces sp. YIM 121038]|nr:hypothetical protein C9F11_10255 [Streptomyces sp. YIM 121038]